MKIKPPSFFEQKKNSQNEERKSEGQKMLSWNENFNNRGTFSKLYRNSQKMELKKAKKLKATDTTSVNKVYGTQNIPRDINIEAYQDLFGYLVPQGQ